LDETDDIERVAGVLERWTASEFEVAGDEIDVEWYEVLSSMRMNAEGLVRYWKKRGKRAAQPS